MKEFDLSSFYLKCEIECLEWIDVLGFSVKIYRCLCFIEGYI